MEATSSRAFMRPFPRRERQRVQVRTDHAVSVLSLVAPHDSIDAAVWNDPHDCRAGEARESDANANPPVLVDHKGADDAREVEHWRDLALDVLADGSPQG